MGAGTPPPPPACNRPVHSKCDMSSHLGEGRSKRIWFQKFKIFNFRQISKKNFHFREPTTTYLASNVGKNRRQGWVGGVKKLKLEETSFMDGPLAKGLSDNHSKGSKVKVDSTQHGADPPPSYNHDLLPKK